jgi:hypothetical protein
MCPASTFRDASGSAGARNDDEAIDEGILVRLDCAEATFDPTNDELPVSLTEFVTPPRAAELRAVPHLPKLKRTLGGTSLPPGSITTTTTSTDGRFFGSRTKARRCSSR